ncbi:MULTISPECIES: topoisomerase IV [Alteromonadaceae]|uniref:Topoisomerase IV n=1 Tax=Brumicola blandensis TaxID=3075611 RepID=A0AAW8QVU2_9ALTE|nr:MULTISPECIES: topoisomerase IV [unclassified Alteromonas]MDT0581231.1 topoisomerase IV [Alteromonas sp. W409]MDT0626848.1 topoisomerase IV [Alteromonas sp. W364]
MIKFNSKLAVVATAVIATFQAQADVRINGFANLTGGITSSDDTLYGYEDRLDFSSQSLFAIQVSGDINSRTTATGQVVARGSNDFSADFEWAYLTYEISDKTSISGGRLRMPLFRYSASLDVGYSYHWVAAPQSVYNVPFNNIEGVRLDYSDYSGDLEYTFQATTGTIDNEFTLGGASANLNVENVVVLTGDFTYNNWKFRGVYATGKATFDIPTLAPTIGQLEQLAPDLASTLDANDDTGVFYGASIEYDTFNWFVAAEFTGVEIEQSFYPDELNYYVTAGIRTGKWTPFITYEKSDLNNPPKFLDEVAAAPAPFQPALTQIVVGVQQLALAEESTVSVGARYDLDTNLALKADITRNTNDLDDTDRTLLRFAVNYVF